MAIKLSNQITFTEHKKIKEIKEWYLSTPLSTGVTRNTEGWTTTVPAIDSTNKYLWNYEEVVYSIGASDTSDPVIIGFYGKGEDGVSIVKHSIQYQTSNSGSSVPTGEWYDSVPNASKGMFLWTKTVISYSDSTSTESYSVGYIGTDGNDGVDGTSVTIKDTSVTYGESDSAESQPTTWNSTMPVVAPGEYLWTKTTIEYTDSTKTTTYTYSRQGFNGNDGLPGTNGKDGASTYVHIKYSAVENPTDDQITETPSKYIGICTTENIEDPTTASSYKWSKWEGKDGEDGLPGPSGSDGVSSYVHFAYSTSSDGKEDFSVSWFDEAVYLGVCTDETPSDPTSYNSYTWSKIRGDDGQSGASLEIKYISSTTYPAIISNDVSQWSDVIPAPQDGYTVYMTQKLSNQDNWSTPIQISAEDGTTPTITIVNGYWCINGENTSVKAEGESPEITIKDGNWFINGVNSGNKAQGEAGKDGASVEYVYYISTKEETSLAAPSYTNNVLTSGWTTSPTGITKDNKYEYVSVRTKPFGANTTWGNFSQPVIWSKWGDKGQDGDGVEYKYYLKNDSAAPTYVEGDTNWTDDPTGVSINNQYEFVVQIKTVNETSTVSEASLWAKYGADGKGISSIVNYYTTTTSVEEQPSDWKSSVPELTQTNKYLWNYEKITYTDGTSTNTDKAIIGAYGDSGADAIDFQIYSVDGFEFKESADSIELKTIALTKGQSVTGTTYKWYWWDSSAQNEAGQYGQYIQITGAEESSLKINRKDKYAFSSIKCLMTYNNLGYEDYVTLTDETVVYSAEIKFFNQTNTFYANDLYLAAYFEVYRNGLRVETVDTLECVPGIATIDDSGVITATLDKAYKNGDKAYFVCSKTGGSYYAILGQYNGTSWKKIDETLSYSYRNNICTDDNSHVIVISKEDIDKSFELEVYVKKGDVDIASSRATIVDSNDPIISDVQPTNPVIKQLWLNTGVTPNKLMMYTDNGWIDCSKQVGGAIFTSKPSAYSQGDLWILAKGESCGSFGEGSMLKANVTSSVFNSYHWADADKDTTTLNSNLKQYFAFDSSTGLKIGEKGENAKFYINISATEMGFYDNADKVVYIGNGSANIDNLIVEGSTFLVTPSATFNRQMHIGKVDYNKDTDQYNVIKGFTWQLEENGSFSLVVG